MNRMLAIVEREMRKFFRSPALMFVSMIFPLVQLIVLGNAFGGKIRDARLGLVDQDGGTQALRIREAFDSVRANMRTFEPIYYNDPKKAMEDVRNGKIEGAVIIPPQYSRKVYEHDQPQIALLVDNSDNFMSAALEDELTQITNALNNPTVEPRILQQSVLQIVELYPYIEYMKFLLPGSITLAIFMSVMIGGGMLYIDDKARGVHEGYLVTPITKDRTGSRTERIERGQGGDGRSRHHRDRVAAGRRGHPVQFFHGGGPAGHDRADRGSLEHHDVPAGGAGRRSAGAARDLRDSEYAAVLPQRRGLSHPGISLVAAGHRQGGPVHFCRTRLQDSAAQGSRLVGHRARHDLSLRCSRW